MSDMEDKGKKGGEGGVVKETFNLIFFFLNKVT